MNAIQFFCVPQIIVQRNAATRLGEWLWGSRVLLISNADAAAGLIHDILTTSGAELSLYRQRGEPTVADVNSALRLCREARCETVVGIGGGSAIDLAKATSAIATNDGEAMDYMEVIGRGQKIVRDPLPWIAIPTTAGTGAEATRNAVIADPGKHFKASIRSERMLAKRVLIDAELAVGVPPAVTAASGCDALCQLIESYTSTGANALTDGMALEGIRLARTALPRVFADGADVEAREQMALAALLSGITLSNAGLGAVHGFAAPLGGNFTVPHGVVCAALLPPIILANVQVLRQQGSEEPSLQRYADACRVLIAKPAATAEAAINEGTEWLSSLTRSMAIPRLAAYGLTDACIPEMVALAQKASSMRYNPVKFTDEQLADILREAI